MPGNAEEERSKGLKMDVRAPEIALKFMAVALTLAAKHENAASTSLPNMSSLLYGF